MSSLKGTAYPKLVESMKGVVSTHAAIVSDVAAHAETANKKRDAERTRIGMVHAAKEALNKEGSA